MKSNLILVAVLAMFPAQSLLAQDFTWEPAEPDIGELTAFEITGVSEPIDWAYWDFGMPGCPGYTPQYTCTPLYTDCLLYGHKFMTGGEKTVSVTVSIQGVSYGPYQHTICVSAVGACNHWPREANAVLDGPCTLLFSDGFDSGDLEGWSSTVRSE